MPKILGSKWISVGVSFFLVLKLEIFFTSIRLWLTWFLNALAGFPSCRKGPWCTVSAVLPRLLAQGGGKGLGVFLVYLRGLVWPQWAGQRWGVGAGAVVPAGADPSPPCPAQPFPEPWLHQLCTANPLLRFHPWLGGKLVSQSSLVCPKHTGHLPVHREGLVWGRSPGAEAGEGGGEGRDQQGHRHRCKHRG